MLADYQIDIINTFLEVANAIWSLSGLQKNIHEDKTREIMKYLHPC